MQPHVEALIHVTEPDRAGGVKLVQVEGDLHAHDLARFRRSLMAAARGAHGLVVDLRGCRFLNRACACAVADLAEELQRGSGKRLHVVTSAESVLDLALEGAWRSRLWTHHTVGAALAEAGAG
jgi:anti-anti-sigma regulatory factor